MLNRSRNRSAFSVARHAARYSCSFPPSMGAKSGRAQQCLCFLQPATAMRNQLSAWPALASEPCFRHSAAATRTPSSARRASRSSAIHDFERGPLAQNSPSCANLDGISNAHVYPASVADQKAFVDQMADESLRSFRQSAQTLNPAPRFGVRTVNLN